MFLAENENEKYTFGQKWKLPNPPKTGVFGTENEFWLAFSMK